MKKFTLLLSALVAVATVSAGQIANNIQRVRLNGIDVIAYKTGVKDVVYLRGSLPAGDDKAPADNSMVPTLVGGMLSRGTLSHTKSEITAMLDAVGASLSFSVNSAMVEFNAKCLAKDVPLVLSLLGEQLREPAFTEEEFSRLKQQTLGGLKRALESTDFRATDTFTRTVYGAGHPNRNATIDERIAALDSATLDNLKAFHAAHYGPAYLTVVAAGDLDVASLQAAVTKSFAGWSGGTPRLVAVKNSATDDAKEQTVFMADKTSVNIVIGQATGMKYTDADAIALRTGTAILGSGFTGRLMANVRDKEGLTYDIGAGVANDMFADGEWKITATFAPALLDKGIASAKRQLTNWYENGVTAKELEHRKDNLVGSFKVGLATTDGLAQNLLVAIHRGKELTWLDEYPQVVNSLSLEQVNGVIKKHLNPDEMFLIKAGTVPEAAK